MKLPLSLTLVVSLVVPALPGTAQAQVERSGSFDLHGLATPATAGPLASAMTREAVRLAAAAEPAGGEAVQQSGKPVESNWSRVRKLAPGTEILVTVKGSLPVQRYFVAGDESNLTLLNVADPALSATARDVLRDVASNHPNYFPGARQGGTFVLEKNVRVAPDGVFVADRKVTELSQVVEQIERQDIAEITTAAIERNVAGCAVAGYYGGAIVGGLPGAVLSGAVGRDTGPALLGMMVGWSVGAAYVYLKCRHKPEAVIYRALSRDVGAALAIRVRTPR